jgi:hypothetical protein
MAEPVGALLLVLTLGTSAVPSFGDRAMVNLSPYRTLEDCQAAMRGAPLSDQELATERQYGLRLIRTCMRPDDSIDYNWTTGQHPGNRLIERGPPSKP